MKNDGLKELSKQDQALLRWHRSQTDSYQEKAFKTQWLHPNINADYDRARREEKEFVQELRRNGFRI